MSEYFTTINYGVGTPVYLRDNKGFATDKRGVITSYDGRHTATVKWDDGPKHGSQLITIRSLIAEEQVEREKAQAAEENRMKEKAMKTKDCALGTVVYLSPQPGDHLKDNLRKGKIAGPVSPHPQHGDVVIVEWDGGRLDKVPVKALLSETVGIAEQTRRQAEVQKLEEEFALVEEQVRIKLNQAAKLIDEAGVVAKKAGKQLAQDYDMPSDFYEAARELERAMDRAGWRTSSWYC